MDRQDPQKAHEGRTECIVQCFRYSGTAPEAFRGGHGQYREQSPEHEGKSHLINSATGLKFRVDLGLQRKRVRKVDYQGERHQRTVNRNDVTANRSEFRGRPRHLYRK